MKLTLKRGLILFTEFVGTETLFFFLSKIKTEHLIMKSFFEYAILIGLVIAVIVVVFQLIYWRYTYMYKSIKKQHTINKFITIMILRFENQYPNHSCSVFAHDIERLFTKDEIEYILSYLKDKERLKIIMKGKNEIHGQDL
jgi:hypothetical protein